MTMSNTITSAIAAAVLASALWQQPPAAGQTPPQQPQGQGQGQGQGRGEGRRGGGGFGRGPAPFDAADRAGFTPIFDGSTLKGWDGDSAFWRVEAGTIVGETTAEKPLKQNTFLIYRGDEPGDFELKLQFRMNATNSGVQFRSVQVPEGTPAGGGGGEPVGKWVLKGYQADIDFDNRYTGMFYEERGSRGFLAPRGVASYIGDDSVKKTIGRLERNADELKAIIKPGDWNDVHIIARGSTMMHIVNGHVTAILIDDDTKNRTLKGLIGLQIHVGPPMKIEFRNVALKKL
jgi:3-keto-disaccharide hydrolase